MIRWWTPSISAAAFASASRTSGPGRERRRLAVGQVDHADLVAGVDQPGQRAAAGDLQVVRVGPDGDDVQLFVRRIGHGGASVR